MKPTETSCIYLSGATVDLMHFSVLNTLGSETWKRRYGFYKEFADLAEYKYSKLRVLAPGARPIKNSSLSPGSVFDSYMDLISSSELVVALLDVPSLEVGTEIALAYNEGVPVLGALPVGSATSPFVEGFLEKRMGCAVYRYNDLKDLVAVAATEIETPNLTKKGEMVFQKFVISVPKQGDKRDACETESTEPQV